MRIVGTIEVATRIKPGGCQYKDARAERKSVNGGEERDGGLNFIMYICVKAVPVLSPGVK